MARYKRVKKTRSRFSEDDADVIFHDFEEPEKGKRVSVVIKKFKDGTYKIQLHREYHRSEGGYASYPLNSIGEEEIDIVQDLLKRAKKELGVNKWEDDKKKRDEIRELLLRAKALRE